VPGWRDAVAVVPGGASPRFRQPCSPRSRRERRARLAMRSSARQASRCLHGDRNERQRETRRHGAYGSPGAAHQVRSLRQRVGCGPCADDRRGSRGPHAYASAAGSRASCYAGGCSVETCACSRGQTPMSVRTPTVTGFVGSIAQPCRREDVPDTTCGTIRRTPTKQRYAGVRHRSNQPGPTTVRPPGRAWPTRRRGRADGPTFSSRACGSMLDLSPSLLLASGRTPKFFPAARTATSASLPMYTACGQLCGRTAYADDRRRR